MTKWCCRCSFFSCFSGDHRQSTSSALPPAGEDPPDLRSQDPQSSLPASTSHDVSALTQAELRSCKAPPSGDPSSSTSTVPELPKKIEHHVAVGAENDNINLDPQANLPASTVPDASPFSVQSATTSPTQSEPRPHEAPASGDPSSSTSTVPELTKKIEDHVAVGAENESINLEGIIQDISELFNIIKTKSSAEKPSTDHYWPSSSIFLKLKDILSEATDGALATKDIISSSEGMKVVKHLLQGLGQAHWAVAGLLVVANILERFEMVAANRDECLSLLEQMSTLAQHVKYFKKRIGMEASIKKATEMIVEGALMCCAQINSSSFSRFFKTSVNKEKLAKFQQKLQIMYRRMDNEVGICILDAIECANVRPPVKERERSYPEYAVGIEEALEEVIELLEWESRKEAVAVMVHGLGGMGKTTLADAVFARLYIEGCKYSMVRLSEDISKTPDINIIDLQKRILKDLMSERSEQEEKSVLEKIHTFEDGQREIGRMLEKEVAFIYIDNVLAQSPLEKLLPRDIKAKRCRLLITARDREVRKGCSMDNENVKFYGMEYLKDTEAMNLLKKELHFQKKDDRELLSFDQLQQVVKHCGGIPLLLHLLARYIRYGEGGQQEAFRLLMEDQKKWNLKIEGFEGCLFTYDRLPEIVKDPFLDICSFFNGSDWNKVRNVVGDSNIDVLEKRGLVKKDKNMKVTVHDVILTIASQKSEGTRFTFKNEGEIEKFLKKDLHGIKGISLNLMGDKIFYASNPHDDYLEILISARKLDSMSDSLRILALGSFGKVEGTCENFFEKLVYLEGKVPYLPFDVSQSKELRYIKCRPRNLNFLKEISANLKHMELNGKMLESDDVFEIFSNDLQQHKDLRTLELSAFYGLKKLPDELGNSLKCLQELDLSCCYSMEELPGSVSEIQSLRELRLSYCESLKSLPENLGSLSSLQTLDLSWCVSIEEVPSISNLQSLRDLSMNKCIGLKRLPEDLGSLSSLQKLDISGCSTLKELPEDLGSLSSLQTLDLGFCSSVEEIPRSFSKLQSLRELSMFYCSRLKMLPEDFGNLISLQKLDLSNCFSIEELPKSFSMLKSLRQLKLVDCSSLKSLPEDLGSLSSLQSLDLSNCNSIEELPGSFSKLPPLKKLKMGGCKFEAVA